MEPDEITIEDGDGSQTPPGIPIQITNRPRRAKRLRLANPGSHVEQSFSSVQRTPQKRLKRPADYFPEAPRSTRRCAFCQIPGSVRECEGSLIGPIRATGKAFASTKSIYAHLNCAIWAPEVFQAEKTGNLIGVHAALARSKKFKCHLCNGPTPSLSCMFQNTACCRPMHFRCALLQGATLIEGFKTFCPKHRTRSDSPSGVGPPPSVELHYERTPIDEAILRPGSGCTKCDGDSYNPELGSILTCATCGTRHHSKCMWPELEVDGGFSAMSWEGKYLCKKCMMCVSCNRAIDTDVYDTENKRDKIVEQGAFDEGVEAEDGNGDCDTVKCVECKHFACHVECLPDGSSSEMWRCDLCLVCKHCNSANIPRGEWNESCEACGICANEIRKGGVVCPVCVKVYREGENIPMVQCDYCDKWIHARKCAGLSDQQFKDMTQSDDKYRCPVCEMEKSKRELDRRRAKSSTGKYNINGIGSSSARTAVDLSPILHQMPVNETELTFHSVRRADTEADNFDDVLARLVPDVEVCRRCCSSGHEQNFLLCIDCGESYHEFCHDSGGATPFSKSVPSKRNSLNAKAIDKRLWRCVQCEAFNHARHAMEVNGTELKPTGPVEEPLRPNGHSLDLILCNGSNNSGSSSVSPSISTEILATPKVSVVAEDCVTWDDSRRCELCLHRECPDGKQGRLIPWASITDSNDSNCWVHVGCLIWSVGVSMHGSGNPYDVLLAPRRRLLHFARQTICVSCGCRGATLRCASSGCTEYFHFDCAISSGVGSLLTFGNELLGRALLNDRGGQQGVINMVDIESVSLFCPHHRTEENIERQGCMDLGEAQALINLRRVVRIFDTTDFSKDFEPPRKKALKPGRLLSIRVGTLSVLQFGRLVPEVNDFIVKGCLVPYGYCATRRFWSMVHPWKRCLYFFEVSGYPETGPEFVIRCNDCVSEQITAKDPDEAWSVVRDRITELRNRDRIDDKSRYIIHTTGLEAFGLSHCIPVVTHVESLSLASMFNGRYLMKRVATHRSNEVVFYNSLAKKYVPTPILENDTGSSRSQGYVTERWKRRRLANSPVALPTCQNARTGAAFQLQVAREVFSRNEYIAPRSRAVRNRFVHGEKLTSKSFSSVDRSRANKSAPMLPFATQHRAVAKTSRARTVILRSDIDGCGVFATRDIRAGEMLIEYVGELIRPVVSDLREARYQSKGIGCYFFEIESGVIVDATVCGNAARYINHSCNPNCYSNIIALENSRKVVVIFAKRNIQRGEELSYDYLFPYDESDRVKCGCGTDRCKGWMN